jgi:hypothetical protein
MPAPIALFTYNRPEHTRATIEALSRNPLAAESELIAFSDAPKLRAHQDGVLAVRELLRSIRGFGKVAVVERESNLGLAGSIIDGTTSLCESHGRVIVIEDDLIVSKYFLQFMNEALERYRDEPRVMQIAGSMFRVDNVQALPETFFCRLPASWGWGTWQRAWTRFEPDARKLYGQLATRGAFWEFDIKGSYDYSGMLRQQAEGVVDSWAVRWYASMFMLDGLCLRPTRSLVHNIGFDGTGVHCGVTDAFDVEVAEAPVRSFPAAIAESEPVVNAIAAFFRSLDRRGVRSLAARAKSWLQRLGRRAAGSHRALR